MPTCIMISKPAESYALYCLLKDLENQSNANEYHRSLCEAKSQSVLLVGHTDTEVLDCIDKADQFMKHI